MSAMLPPPAPISIMSIAGMRIGRPLPWRKLVHTRDFHGVALNRRAAANDRALGGGAAHVEGEQVRQVEAAAVVGAHQSAGGGPDSSARTG
jgi:hypothetical protein